VVGTTEAILANEMLPDSRTGCVTRSEIVIKDLIEIDHRPGTIRGSENLEIDRHARILFDSQLMIAQIDRQEYPHELSQHLQPLNQILLSIPHEQL
jgi:hypothetical protein